MNLFSFPLFFLNNYFSTLSAFSIPKLIHPISFSSHPVQPNEVHLTNHPIPSRLLILSRSTHHFFHKPLPFDYLLSSQYLLLTQQLPTLTSLLSSGQSSSQVVLSLNEQANCYLPLFSTSHTSKIIPLSIVQPSQTSTPSCPTPYYASNICTVFFLSQLYAFIC